MPPNDEELDLLARYIGLRLSIVTNPRFGGSSKHDIKKWKKQLADLEKELIRLGLMKPI